MAFRFAKLFAVFSILIMMLVGFSPIVQTTSANPISPDSLDNQTVPPPVDTPVPPPDELQRPAELGTVIQGWDDGSLVSQIMDRRSPILIESDSQLVYKTSYGNFFLLTDSPYFIGVQDSVGGKVADSAFLVMFEGAILEPANGVVDSASSDLLVFHYDLIAAGQKTAGQVTVTYEFFDDKNKITAEFSSLIGTPDRFQIVWLTFTTWKAVDTAYPADSEQRFDDLRPYYGTIFNTLYATGAVEIPGAIIRPDKTVGSPGGYGLRLDASDAAADFTSAYAGKFNFGGYSGNAVLITFTPGKLLIDPQLIVGSYPTDATAYSGIQRKTFYDGQRYWLFWKSSTGVVSYSSSVDGKNWNPLRTAVTAAGFSYGFTVINSGFTVGVLWTDSSEPTSIRIRTGLITNDVIMWDDADFTGRPIFTICGPSCLSGNVASPVSATFTSGGNEFGITWRDTGFLGDQNRVGFLRFRCTGTGSGFSPCAVSPGEPIGGSLDPDWGYGSGTFSSSYRAATAVAFNDRGGLDDRIARITVEDIGTSTGFYVKVFSGSNICSESEIEVARAVQGGLNSAWWSDGKFATTATGNDVALLYDNGNPQVVYVYLINAYCGSRQDNYFGAASVKFLSAGTDEEGAIYAFYTSSLDGKARHTRVVPDFPDSPSPTLIFSSYAPVHMTVAHSASHFVPLAFTVGSNLYYSNYPLPLDGEASVTNPWALKLGAPLITDVGVVSPTTGLLANGQTLVGGEPSISLIYREPGLFNLDGTKYGPNDRYQIIPGMYFDFPWIDAYSPGVFAGVLHMTGGQKYSLALTGFYDGNPNDILWYNITKGVRYTIKLDYDAPSTSRWTLTMPSGAYMTFDTSGNLTKVYLDTTGQNYISYSTVSGQVTGTITDASGRVISFSTTSVSYGNGQSITLNTASGVPAGCTGTSADSGTLKVIDTIGRATNYYVCKWKLTKLESPNGGRADYAYTSNPLDTAYSCTYPSLPISQGTDAYSCPVTRMDIYNDSAAGVKARSLVFNWNFQNGEVVEAVVDTVDKSGVVQGNTRYSFNPAMGTVTVKTFDSAGQILSYDMETLNAGKIKDLSGNGWDGTLSNPAPTVSFGKFGKGRTYDGSIKYVNAGDIKGVWNQFTVVATFSITAWPANWGNVVSKDTTVGGIRRGFSIYTCVAGSAGCGAGLPNQIRAALIYQPGWSDVVVASSPSLNRFYTVAMTYDPYVNNQRFKVYLDGAYIGSADSVTDTSLDLTGKSFTVGIYSDLMGIPFTGTVDEVKVFTRALGSEDITSLYSLNAIRKGAQQNWYSINGQPHLAEGFVGDDTSASVVTSDMVDDWGNQIYHRDALGQETFASFANTNHQNHFYAPGRLTKDTGTFSTEFIDFTEGVFPTGVGSWVVASTATTPAEVDFGTFEKIMPSLKINAPPSGITTITHTSPVTFARFVEFRARVNVVGDFEIRLGDSDNSDDFLLGAKFGSGSPSYLSVWDNVVNSWRVCNYPNGIAPTYVLNAWYRFTFEIDKDTTGYPWNAYINGMDLVCGVTTKLDGGTGLSKIHFVAVSALSGWVDDIKIYDSSNGLDRYDALKLGFSGLQVRQSIALLGEDGKVIDQTMQTGAGTVYLSFNSALAGALKYYENGHNAKTVVRIYAEDDTLEYQSPLTRFFVGERYTYTRPKAFADELVKIRSGALYWPNTVYVDEDCTGVTCNGVWTWKQSPDIRGALRGTKVHVTPFDYGVRTHCFVMSSGVSMSSTDYFVINIRIPTGKAPDGIAFNVATAIPGSFCGAVWSKKANWGASFSVPGVSDSYLIQMGSIPEPRDQWTQLVIRASDLDLTGSFLWYGMHFAVAGGEIEWDVATTRTSASLTVSGLPVGTTIGIYYANNGTLISTGTENQGIANALLYNPVKGITSFPVNVKIKIYDSTTEWYFGPARDVWPGDTFTWVGQSSFFDSKSSGTIYWPTSSVHTALIGSKKFSGDCLDAGLCLNMESFTEGTSALDTGVVTISATDLSGKGNNGVVANPRFASVGDSAAGLGTKFYSSAMSSIAAATSGDVTVTLPAHKSGDLLLLLGWIRSGTSETVTMSGWTAMTGTPFARSTTRYWLFWKVAASSSETALFNTDGTTGNVYAAAAVYRGVGAGIGDPWLVKGPPTVSTNDPTPDPASLTGISTPIGDALIIAAIGGEDDNNAASTTVYGTNPSAYASYYVESTAGTDGAILFAEARQSSAGATGTVEVDWDAGNPVGWGGMVLAITLTATPYVQVPSSSTIRYSSTLSVSAWVKTDVIATGIGRIVEKGGDWSNAWEYSLYRSAASVCARIFNPTGTGGTEYAGICGGTLTTARPYHVAFTWKASPLALRLFIDGAFVAQDTTGSGTVPAVGDNSLKIGARELRNALGTVGMTEQFSGSIDQVLVYQKTLTDTEILALYHSRVPGAPQTYLRTKQDGTGFPITSKTPYEGAYLYVAATYDAEGNVLSVTDVGRTISGGANVTNYEYSTLYNGDYQTMVRRPDLKEVYYAYDFQTGVQYGTLDINCRRTRIQYDAIGRPIQTSVYDNYYNVQFLHLDMETAAGPSLKDVSCQGTGDSQFGYGVSITGTTKTAGIEGMARGFDGVDDKLTSSPQAFSVWTFALWIYYDGTSANSFQHPIGLGTGHDATVYVTKATNVLSMKTTNSAGATVVNAALATLTLNTWYHVAVTFDGTYVSGYVDGVLRSTQSGATSVIRSNNAKVGTSGSESGNFFGGRIDEVRIFSLSLVAADVTALARFSYGRLTTSTVAYDDTFPTSVTSYDSVSIPRALFYDMETCIVMPCASGGKVEDLSGHGIDGTMTGTANDPAGRIGSARSFNGAGDIITSAVVSGFSKTSITVSAWVKVSAHKDWIDYVHTNNWCAAAGSWNLYSDAAGKANFAITSSSCTWAAAVSSQTIPLGTWTHLVGTYDGTTIKVYVNAQTPGTAASVGLSLDTTSPVTLMYGDDAGSLDEIQIISRDFTSAEISALYSNLEISHMSKSYQDGLGRTTRTVAMDLFGKKIQTVATLGWNDQPVYSYLPSGQYATFTYDFLGRTLTSQTPGDATISGISETITSEKARTVESVDAVGRKAYVKTDLLGRTIETAVWNPATSAYGNLTSVAYNALSKITTSKDAKLQTTTIYYNSLGIPKMSVLPDGTYSVIYYDDNLRAFRVVDVMGRVAVSVYDNIGRVTSVTLRPSLSTPCSGTPNPCVVSYGYDSQGNLATIDNTTAKITRTYDSLYRMLTEKLDVPASIPAFTGTITYAYDSASKITSITYPVSTTLCATPCKAVYTYDSLGRAIQVDYGPTSAPLKYAVLTYDAFGKLDNINYWKGSTDTTLQEKYTYDTRDRVTQVKVFDTGSTYMKLDYTYNKASEIVASTDNMLGTDKSVTYSYDGNGRLASASGPWGAAEATETHAYTYDQVGNLLTWKLGATTYTYTYAASPAWNELSSFSYNTMSFTYNAAGSMLTKVESGATTAYTQDYLQQLVKVLAGGNTYTYNYDGLGRRVKTIDPNLLTTYFMYAGSMLYSKDTAGTETAFVYVGGKLLLKKEGTLDARYYHQDISPGNVRLITYYTVSVQIAAKYRYRPFGDMIVLSGVTQRFQYAHQEFDSALRLYHMGARYYDPLVGRFIQRDPIGSGYSYASNNPISAMDPSGMTTWWGNVMNWWNTPMARRYVSAALIVVGLAGIVPSGGGSLAAALVAAGIIAGVIAVGIVYVASGGRASLHDYILAFSIGFAIGVGIASVAQAFAVRGGSATLRTSNEELLLASENQLGRTGTPGNSADEVAEYAISRGSRRYYETYRYRYGDPDTLSPRYHSDAEITDLYEGLRKSNAERFTRDTETFVDMDLPMPGMSKWSNERKTFISVIGPASIVNDMARLVGLPRSMKHLLPEHHVIAEFMTVSGHEAFHVAMMRGIYSAVSEGRRGGSRATLWAEAGSGGFEKFMIKKMDQIISRGLVGY